MTSQIVLESWRQRRRSIFINVAEMLFIVSSTCSHCLCYLETIENLIMYLSVCEENYYRYDQNDLDDVNYMRDCGNVWKENQYEQECIVAPILLLGI